MTAPTTTPTEQVVIRQLDTPWMTAQQAAEFFPVSLDQIRRAGREYEKSNGRSGLKALRRSRYGTFILHHDDVLHWLDGKPPLKGTRKFTPA